MKPAQLLFLLALLSAAPASAQVNTERARLAPDFTGVFVDMELRFGFRQGNVNLLDLGGRGRVGYASPPHLVYLLGDSRFAAQTTGREGKSLSDTLDRSARFANRHLGHLRYNLTLAERLIGEAFTQLEADEFVLVNERFLVGTGPRFVLLESPDAALYVGTAYMAEYEALDPTRFISQPGADRPANWWHRWSTYASVRVGLNDIVSATNILYAQPRLDAFGDVRVLDEFSLDVRLTKSLSLKLIGSVSYDSRPPTYCQSRLNGDACADSDIVTLTRTNISVENAFALQLRQ